MNVLPPPRSPARAHLHPRPQALSPARRSLAGAAGTAHISLLARGPHSPGCERDARRAHLRRQATMNRPRISRNDASRRRYGGGGRRAPRGSDQGATPRDSGGAGPGLAPEGAIPSCARSFRITAGSCSVAIRRSRPPRWAHARHQCQNTTRPHGGGLGGRPTGKAVRARVRPGGVVVVEQDRVTPDSRRHRSRSPA